MEFAGEDERQPAAADDAAGRVQLPHAAAAGALPWPQIYAIANAGYPNRPTSVARSDYAINGGDFQTFPGTVWPALYGNKYCGPANLADGGVPPCSLAQAATARAAVSDVAEVATGIGYFGSMVKMTDVTDGASNTYLVGEKNIEPDYYVNGYDPGDNEDEFMGENEDISRWTGMLSTPPDDVHLPYPDTPGYVYGGAFGSAHADGFYISFCDGSVRFVSYSIDPYVHKYLGNRKDGQVIDAKKL